MRSEKQATILALLRRAVAALGARAQARRHARQQASQLGGMSEHELLDLGIGRSEVPAVLSASQAR
ncbi:hypothetical protein GCM10023165_13240 [Variovorax defluvii]|uniref:YjiS-like domain-containing protein n=1 Tax=Variovorax defluvii TaxID=913761 RepID=A0ABP8HA20_9BURK